VYSILLEIAGIQRWLILVILFCSHAVKTR
jgi:hypothetical protein